MQLTLACHTKDKVTTIFGSSAEVCKAHPDALVVFDHDLHYRCPLCLMTGNNDDLESELKEVAERLDARESECDSLHDEVIELSGQITELNSAIEELETDLDALEED